MAKTQRPLIVGSDFNCVENIPLDAKNRKDKKAIMLNT